MKASVITGALQRDYIEFEAESVAESAALCRVGNSRFIPQDFLLLLTHGSETWERIALRVYFGPERGKQLSVETREAIDATP